MEKLPLLIGICGRMGAGKDTLAAQIAARYHSPEYLQWKFADALRGAASLVSGVPVDKTLSAEDKAVDLSQRRYEASQLHSLLCDAIGGIIGGTAYQTREIGLLAGKMFEILTGTPYQSGNGDARLHMTIGRLLQLLGTEGFRECVGPNVWVEALFARWLKKGRPPILIADVRFPNEADALRQRGGAIVLVRRENAGRTDGRSTEHASERGLREIKPDIIIENDGTLEQLRALVGELWTTFAAQAELRAVNGGERPQITLRASSFPDIPNAAGGKRSVYIEEPDQAMVLNVARMKELVGSDTIPARDLDEGGEREAAAGSQ
jgi:hypothetical protein